LIRCGLTTLEKSRCKGDLIEAYKIFGNLPNGVPKFQYVFYASAHASVSMLRQCLSISTGIIMAGRPQGCTHISVVVIPKNNLSLLNMTPNDLYGQMHDTMV